MPDYKAMYYRLFNAVSDVIEELKKIQIESEEFYLDSTDDEKETEE